MEEPSQGLKEADFQSLEQELGQIDSNIQGSVHMKPGAPGSEPEIRVKGLEKKISVLCILGLIFSFLPPVGLILSIIGIVRVNMNSSELKGKGLAVFGILMAILFLVFELIFIFGVSFSGIDGTCEMDGPFECTRVNIQGKSLLIEVEGKLPPGSFLQRDPEVYLDGQRCLDPIVPGDPVEEQVWITCKVPEDVLQNTNIKEGSIILEYYHAGKQTFETAEGIIKV